MEADFAELHTPPRRSLLPDGYTEFQFLEAVRKVIQACGGNRSIAEGVAIELVKQETERK